MTNSILSGSVLLIVSADDDTAISKETIAKYLIALQRRWLRFLRNHWFYDDAIAIKPVLLFLSSVVKITSSPFADSTEHRVKLLPRDEVLLMTLRFSGTLLRSRCCDDFTSSPI